MVTHIRNFASGRDKLDPKTQVMYIVYSLATGIFIGYLSVNIVAAVPTVKKHLFAKWNVQFTQSFNCFS